MSKLQSKLCEARATVLKGKQGDFQSLRGSQTGLSNCREIGIGQACEMVGNKRCTEADSLGAMGFGESAPYLVERNWGLCDLTMRQAEG